MKYSIVLSTHPASFAAVAYKGDFEANIERIATLGYKGVELAVRDPRQVDVAALEAVLVSRGLCVPAIGTGQAWGEEKLSFTDRDSSVRKMAVERIKSHIPLAARFGAVIIIGLIRGRSPDGQSHDRSMQLLIHALQECAETATSLGVRFALEPINRYETDLVNTVSEGLELLSMVGAENLGLLLDTFHMNIEEPAIESAIHSAGRSIYHFHVADSNRWYPGAGHLDFQSILSELISTGYKDYISGEFLPEPDSNIAARMAIMNLRKIDSMVSAVK